ncbi:transmembrane protein 68-like [Sphaerodactylus townsendi]|uniref:transmembrane protein 68-like n=1 Tax=Sphaerodactylus townsendi TaxID=933632 RepID=UPI002026BF04|nr:transmembrane protein 68-like [Sphaerodactylus townsendi]
MIGRNESCSSEQIPMSYIACLLYILEGLTGVQHLEDYLNYVAYLLWLFAPLVVSFILPGLILLLLYASVIILHIYKRRTDLKEAYSNDFWDGARQMLATLWYGHAKIWNELFRWMYENFRLPIVPLYGNFPVKLRTFLGEPIPYQPRVSSEELAEQAKSGVQFLINKHQKLPGNVFRALMERFTIQKKED